MSELLKKFQSRPFFLLGVLCVLLLTVFVFLACVERKLSRTGPAPILNRTVTEIIQIPVGDTSAAPVQAEPTMERRPDSGSQDSTTGQIVVDYCHGDGSLGMGGSSFPVDMKYNNFGEVGVIFTADDCGKARMKELDWETYTNGVRVFLKSSPSDGLLQMFKSRGFVPGVKCVSQSERTCKAWEFKEDISVSNLLKLKTFAQEFDYVDCIECG